MISIRKGYRPFLLVKLTAGMSEGIGCSTKIIKRQFDNTYYIQQIKYV